MKKLILILAIGVFTSLNSSAQTSKFDEDEFIKYVNSLRETNLIRSEDSCAQCVNELFSSLEKRDTTQYSDIIFYYPKNNEKYGQFFVSVLTKNFYSANDYFSDIVKPLMKKIVCEKNKHFVLFHKELGTKVLIVFKVFK